MVEHILDGLAFFVRAFVVISLISLVGAGVKWLWERRT